MADVTMTVVDGSKSGVLDITNHANVQLGNATGADHFYFPNDGRTVLVCVCGAAAKQLTFTAIANQWGRTETLTPTQTSNNTSVIGPFRPDLFDNPVEFQAAAGGLATDFYLALRVS